MLPHFSPTLRHFLTVIYLEGIKQIEVIGDEAPLTYPPSSLSSVLYTLVTTSEETDTGFRW
ncbi:hypothetical protein HanHA300_Chr16g0611681 [Helianthus annuus]|nr:hypothetical protein HanHA300_Chr16g0611681 [Helianthus annuus]KAJ0460565.1 hypothetical protein HanHA89_Chr16g0662271 [Helianthus annuus]